MSPRSFSLTSRSRVGIFYTSPEPTLVAGRVCSSSDFAATLPSDLVGDELCEFLGGRGGRHVSRDAKKRRTSGFACSVCLLPESPYSRWSDDGYVG